MNTQLLLVDKLLTTYFEMIACTLSIVSVKFVGECLSFTKYIKNSVGVMTFKGVVLLLQNCGVVV